MLPVLIGLFSAMAFGMLSHAVYGTADAITQPWIDIMFWILIGTGVSVSAINIAVSCLPCRVSRAIGARGLVDRLCAAHCKS